MSVRRLNEHHLEFLSLKGGCTCSSESKLVKMPHCWKSHNTTHLLLLLLCGGGGGMLCWFYDLGFFVISSFAIIALRKRGLVVICALT